MSAKLKMMAAYDDQAIWGTGHVERGALNNAKGYRDNGDISGLETAIMSEYLAEWVENNGGDVGFSLEEDGVLYFIDDEGELL